MSAVTLHCQVWRNIRGSWLFLYCTMYIMYMMVITSTRVSEGVVKRASAMVWVKSSSLYIRSKGFHRNCCQNPGPFPPFWHSIVCTLFPHLVMDCIHRRLTRYLSCHWHVQHLVPLNILMLRAQ